MSNDNQNIRAAHYPLADAIPTQQLDAELAQLEAVQQKPFFSRIYGYMKLGGPVFIGAG